jgi:hypothetical protein
MLCEGENTLSQYAESFRAENEHPEIAVQWEVVGASNEYRKGIRICDSRRVSEMRPAALNNHDTAGDGSIECDGIGAGSGGRAAGSRS